MHTRTTRDSGPSVDPAAEDVELRVCKAQARTLVNPEFCYTHLTQALAHTAGLEPATKSTFRGRWPPFRIGQIATKIRPLLSAQTLQLARTTPDR